MISTQNIRRMCAYVKQSTGIGTASRMQERRTVNVEKMPESNQMQVSRNTNYHGVEYPTHIVSSLFIKTCGIQRCIPGFTIHHPRKEGYYLHVVLSGKGILKVNGREIEIHEGQLFQLRDQEECCYEADLQNAGDAAYFICVPWDEYENYTNNATVTITKQ